MTGTSPQSFDEQTTTALDGALGTVNTHEANCHVLVVDDNDLDRRLAGGILRRRKSLSVTFADSGLSALDALDRDPPDLVLTDMLMPEMNGLELVETIRERHATIPTILMTAHGSEELAVQALQRGAASYVPKRNLAYQLLDTVWQVMDSARATRDQQRLHDCWQTTQFEFQLRNDTSLISPLVSHLQNYVSAVREYDDNDLIRHGVALHEAMRNAIHHGNLELSSDLRSDDPNQFYEEAEQRRQQSPYKDRVVVVNVSESRNESRYHIRDEGPGFDTRQIRQELGQTVNLDKNSGRGLLLIQTFMDEVHFNERGNEITMVHRRRAAE